LKIVRLEAGSRLRSEIAFTIAILPIALLKGGETLGMVLRPAGWRAHDTIAAVGAAPAKGR
jgi:hypothetical protein